MSNDEQQACKRDNNQVKCYMFYDNQSILEKWLIKTTNGEIGLVADQNDEIWNCTIFVLWVFREMSKLSIYTKRSSLKVNLHEQKAYTFVQFSDFDKNWHF